MTDPSRSPFDPPFSELRKAGNLVVELVSRFVDQRYVAGNADYSDLDPLLKRLAAPPPAQGSPWPQLLEIIDTAAAKGFDTANPGFVGYIPGGGLYSAALADFIACGLNRYTGIAGPAPAMVQLEASVLRWLCDTFSLPRASQGVLTPGGSMANLSAVVTARTARLGEDFHRGVIYVSGEVHHSIRKAARFAGFPADAVRLVESDDDLRMDPAALRGAVEEDRRSGRQPFLVVATAGTINTGAVDPLPDIADVAEQERLFFHVDGAYGGFFQLTERGRQALDGIERADTITLDPHKGMFLPYGTGCLLARDGEALRAAHQLDAHYLPPASDDAALPDFSSYSPELSRDFRGLRLWLPLHLHGVDTFVQALDEKLDLARVAHERLRRLAGLELPWEPTLSLVAFRVRGASDEPTHALMDRLNLGGRMWLSSSPVRGRTFIRMCILSHRTRPARVHEMLDIIESTMA